MARQNNFAWMEKEIGIARTPLDTIFAKVSGVIYINFCSISLEIHCIYSYTSEIDFAHVKTYEKRYHTIMCDY